MRITPTLRGCDQYRISAAREYVTQIDDGVLACAGDLAVGMAVQGGFGFRQEFVIRLQVGEEMVVNRARGEDDLRVVWRVDGVGVKRRLIGQPLRLPPFGRDAVDVAAFARPRDERYVAPVGRPGGHKFDDREVG